MTLKAELAAAAVAALNDIRCASVRLYLEDLLKRPKFGGGIPEHRVYIKDTDTPVPDFATLLTHITEANINISYNAVGNSGAFKDKCKPVTLYLKGLEVRLISYLDEDTYLTSGHGKDASVLAITLNYVGDNDTALPLKAIEAAIHSSRFAK